MIPWFEWPYIYDVRARPNVIQSTSGSKDLQMVRSVTLADRSLLHAKLCNDRALAARESANPCAKEAQQLLCAVQVNIGLRVLTRPMPAKLPEIYRSLGTDYAERVLPSIIQVLSLQLSCFVFWSCCRPAAMSASNANFFMISQRVFCLLHT